MNYKKNYKDYIIYVKSLKRKKKNGIYYESHHILPKSLGGKDDNENKVLLTAREHFLAHYLLCKIYENDTQKYFKMLQAFMYMKTGNGRRIYNSRLFSKKKEKLSLLRSEKMKGVRIQPEGYSHSETTKEKMKNKRVGKKPALGYSPSDETKKKISNTLKNMVIMWNYDLQKGVRVSPDKVQYYKQLGYLPHRARKRTEEEKLKTSKQFKGIPKTEEHKKKIRDALRGKAKSKEHVEKMRQNQLGKKASKETKIKLSKAHKGRIWIYKKDTCKMVHKEEIDEFIKKGWNRGRGNKYD